MTVGIDLLQIAFLGLLLGGLYALIGMGFSLLLGVMGIGNVAHGDFAILSAYISFTLIARIGVDPLLSLVVVAPLMFLIGFFIQKVLIFRVMRLSREMPILLAFSLSIIIQNVLLLVYKEEVKSLATSYALTSFNILGTFRVPVIYLLDFAAAFGSMVLLHFFLHRTYMGRAIRAASDDARAAELMGINTSTIYAYTYGISLIFGALAGVMIGMTFIFYPGSGITYLGTALTVVVIGGLGSIKGTFLGGIILGLAQLVGAYFVGIGYQLFIGYVILLAMLALRPEGLLGSKR